MFLHIITQRLRNHRAIRPSNCPVDNYIFAIKSIRKIKAQFILSLTIAMFVHFWFFGSFINTIHCFAIIGIFLYNYPRDYAEKV